jgi:phosphoenolpyruvate---glycerone phosphotransferase subunit DhaL
MEAIMPKLTLNSKEIASLLKQMAVDIKSRVEELRELDSVIGDGDMGITIELAANAIKSFFENPIADDVGEMLMKCGLSINKVSPSTFGTLLAAGFMGAGRVVSKKTAIDIQDLIKMGNEAISNIKSRGKAEVGDKTMLDSLVPAFDAFKGQMLIGAEINLAVKAAVTAAEAGMQATVGMRAKHGRAQWHQEGSVGVQDAGATAVYYMIESFARHLAEYTKN